ISPYGASKAAAEHYCNSYYESFGLNTNIVRFSNVYGSYSLHKTKNLIPAFILSCASSKPFTIYGDGSQTRDFVYIDDLIRAIYNIMIKDIENETFQIATGEELTVNNIVDKMNILYHKKTGN
ncbi:MAG: NAD-dependent epimerase/dehydratase family protein, partial [archaeon]